MKAATDLTPAANALGKNGYPKAFDRLAITGLLLLLIATALAAAVAMQQLRSIAQMEAQARAQRVADSLAERISRALSLGVPLNELVGVPALFDQRMQQVPGIAAVALADTATQTLWLQTPDQSAAERPALSAGSGQPLPSGLRVSALVQAGISAEPVAQVVLVWEHLGTGSLLGKSLLPLLAWPMAVSVLAALALQRSVRRGRMRRNVALQKAIDQILAGDLSQKLPRLRQHEFDSRPVWLGAQLLLVNEQQLRITRLHHSLRQTEPDAVRRSALDSALALADANQRFRSSQTQVSSQASRAESGPGLVLEGSGLPAKPAATWLQPEAPSRGWQVLQSVAWIFLFLGLLLPLLLAFAPQFLAGGSSKAVEAALLLSMVSNGAWLSWIYIRSVPEPRTESGLKPESKGQHAA